MDSKNYQSNIIAKEMQEIMNHAHALVNATTGEIDDRIKSAREALKKGLDELKINQARFCEITEDYGQKIDKDMQDVINHARVLVEATSGEMDQRIKSARLALQERLDAVRSEYRVIEDQIRDKVQTADQLIHTKPYYAIGGTFLAGLFLGWFLSRR